jgi:hypothetical protein
MGIYTIASVWLSYKSPTSISQLSAQNSTIRAYVLLSLLILKRLGRPGMLLSFSGSRTGRRFKRYLSRLWLFISIFVLSRCKHILLLSIYTFNISTFCSKLCCRQRVSFFFWPPKLLDCQTMSVCLCFQKKKTATVCQFFLWPMTRMYIALQAPSLLINLHLQYLNILLKIWL